MIIYPTIYYLKKHKFLYQTLQKREKKYYDTLVIKNITDNNQFWKTNKTFLSEKSKTSSRITLKNKDKTISNDGMVC